MQINRRIVIVAVWLLAGFLALAGQVTWLQVVHAEDLADDPRNSRGILDTFATPRGRLLADDATVLAESRPAEGGEFEFLRAYPEASLTAHAVGFVSLNHGTEGAERIANAELAGQRATQLEDLIDQLTSEPLPGDDVVLTLRLDVQRAMAEALGGQVGAAVALDPQTGAVLGLVSNPAFDPNAVASGDIGAADAAYQALADDPGEPLRNRVTFQSYPAGSTFKVVTAAAALETGLGTPETLFPNPPVLDLPQTSNDLSNFGGGDCGGAAEISLAEALAVSCNVTFGQIGLELGAADLVAQAEAFGINAPVPGELAVLTSRVPGEEAFVENLPLLAFTAIGQFDVQVTPLQMALIAAGVANGGTIMTPYLVHEVRDIADGEVLRRAEPQVWREAMSPANAARLAEMMELVVSSGTGGRAAIEGVRVAGKSGTAQVEEGEAPHAWFIAFAPVDDPVVAVAAVVEHGGDLGSEATGGRVAAPIALAAMLAVLDD